jgi:hypothetical protein
MQTRVRHAVKLASSEGYLVGFDEDGREFIPLYRTEEEANHAAERADLDDWRIVSVDLAHFTISQDGQYVYVVRDARGVYEQQVVRMPANCLDDLEAYRQLKKRAMEQMLGCDVSEAGEQVVLDLDASLIISVGY